jgi:hypothetical protein
MTWSLLRGFGDNATVYLALAVWIATTLWILGNAVAYVLFARESQPNRDRTGFALVLWSVAFFWYIAGLWSQMLAAKDVSLLAWIMPLIAFSLACLFFSSEQLMRLLDAKHRLALKSSALSFFVVSVTLAFGVWLFMTFEKTDPDPGWLPLFQSWQRNDSLLAVAVGVWLGSAVFLCLGTCTRIAAVTAWLMSMSFANANPNLDNAGDTLRLILLFYLMFCPAGAALSLDALFTRRTKPVYVHPWPIRLIFVQMIFLYFMNGLYKLFGASWIEGNSLYYVLGDVALARFSRMELPITFEITRMMTWTTLIWEVTFPVLVLFKWSRRLALVMGVLFHLGIGITMELGGFVPYALCLYLPLVPWEWFCARAKPSE